MWHCPLWCLVVKKPAADSAFFKLEEKLCKLSKMHLLFLLYQVKVSAVKKVCGKAVIYLT